MDDKQSNGQLEAIAIHHEKDENDHAQVHDQMAQHVMQTMDVNEDNPVLRKLTR